MNTLIVHGRQPKLGRAELESLYGSESIVEISPVVTGLNLSPKKINFNRLGGMTKFCSVLTILETTKWPDITKFIQDVAPKHASLLPKGKLNIGLSVFGLNPQPRDINRSALSIKKAIKSTGRNVRVIPNKETQLNAAQVLYNKLTQKMGWELVFVKNGNKTIVAQSIAVQDVDKYSARDYKRPYRDSKVGMLPPKLAQIIINLAVGKLDESGLPVCGPPDYSEITLLDPFCGTGVILQEANLMGIANLYGTDISPRMVEYSKKNLAWFSKEFNTSHHLALQVADATQANWQNFDLLASELYLGQPLAGSPTKTDVQENADKCEMLLHDFLLNLKKQTKGGFRFCIAVPVWKLQNTKLHLKTLENLADLGYNRVKFKFANDSDLIYHRPDQVVARELVVLERN